MRFRKPPPIRDEFLDLLLRRLCPYCDKPWVALHGMREHPEKWVDHDWVYWRDVYAWGPVLLR